MHPIVEQNRERVAELCRRHGVSRLELFGSAAKGTFDPERSDLDFLVEFSGVGPAGLSKRYFGLLFGLEDLFARKIDLVMSRAVHNPYFRQSIDESRVPLYAA